MAGNAFCLHDDLERARDIHPDVPVIAVNGAAREVAAIALFSVHPERFVSKRWIEHQARDFGDSFRVHAPGAGDLPFVDHWWNIKGGGGSAWSARKLAVLMGFDSVVLCGAPLVAGGYANHDLGGLMHSEKEVARLRRMVLYDADWHLDCNSMSGWTRDLLGEPVC